MGDTAVRLPTCPLAGRNPYIFYINGQWIAYHGTRFAAPLWAALIALTDASNSCAGKQSGSPIPSSTGSPLPIPRRSMTSPPETTI